MPGTRWLSDREQAAWQSFVAMYTRLHAQLGRELGGTGLSGQDYEVLVHLSAQTDERSRITQIAHDLGWETSRLSHHLSRMEQRGLVRRERCPSDQRGWRIEATPVGRDAIATAAPQHVESVRRYLIDVLTPRQLTVLETISNAVLDQLPTE